MKFRIRRIDSRDFGNKYIAQVHDYMHVVEQEVLLRRPFFFFGKKRPVWIRVAHGISLGVAESELRKLLDGPRPHAEPMVVKEFEV